MNDQIAVLKLRNPSEWFLPVTQLEEIGSRYIDVYILSEKRCSARKALKEFFQTWKDERCLHWLEKDSPPYQQMVNAAKPEIEKVKDLTRLQKNAKRRLDNAILRMKNTVE